MSTVYPRIIFQGFGYFASAHKIGLIVQYKDKGGVHIPFPKAQEWIEAIEQAVDKGEARALCKSVIGAKSS